MTDPPVGEPATLSAEPTGSGWRRWQLTVPFAALSRRVRTGPEPRTPGAHASEPSTAARAGLPVLIGGARDCQVDATTCGSAVLVMLAASGDPVLADWLETARLPAGPRPQEIPPDVVPGAPVADQQVNDGAARFATAQHHVQRMTCRGALGPAPWPAAWGTPPWTAAREARFPGVRYRVRAFDTAATEAAAVLSFVRSATRGGYPVPLYTGGDLRRGPAHAIPRHVVLVVPPPPGVDEPGTLQIYEPARGSIYRVPLTTLLDRTTPHPALGDWTHVVVALLPIPA